MKQRRYRSNVARKKKVIPAAKNFAANAAEWWRNHKTTEIPHELRIFHPPFVPQKSSYFRAWFPGRESWGNTENKKDLADVGRKVYRFLKLLIRHGRG